MLWISNLYTQLAPSAEGIGAQCVHMCVLCVCACIRERGEGRRERVRGGGVGTGGGLFFLWPSRGVHIACT